MAELKDNQLVFVDENGNEVLCDILFTYDSEEFNKSYVFFAPVGCADEDGKVEVGVASYVAKDGGVGELHQVETDEEWDMLAEVFDSFASEEDDCDCCGEDCDCCGEEDCEEEGCSCCCGHHHHHE